MISFKLTGLADDVRLAGNVSKGPLSRSFERLIVEQPTSDAGFDIVVEQPTENVEGSYVMIEVTNPTGFAYSIPAETGSYAYNEFHHRTHIETDWGDPGATLGAPEKVLPEWRDANRSMGPCVWKKAGAANPDGSTKTYTGTVEVIDDQGNWASKTFTYDVRSRENEWTGANVLVIAHDGDFTGAPGDSETRQEFTGTDLEVAFTAYKALSTPGVLYIKNGGEYTYSSTIGGNFPNFTLIGWGSGAKPVCRNPTSTARALFIDDKFEGTNGSVLIDGVDFEGYWDSTTETVETGKSVTGGIVINSQGVQCSFIDVEASGFSSCFQSLSSGVGDRGRFFFHQCTAQNWQNFGMFFANRTGNRHGILAPMLIQDVQAMQGGSGKSGNFRNDGTPHQPGDGGNEHSGIRIQGSRYCEIRCGDIFGRSDWGVTSVPPLSQAAIRWHAVHPNANGFIYHCTFESGPGTFIGTSTGNGREPVNLVIDGVITGMNAHSKTGGGSGLGGVTRRNCLTSMGNQKRTSGLAQGLGIGGSASGTSDANDAAPVRYYNNTVRFAMNEANLDGAEPDFLPANDGNGGSQNVFDDFILSNNLAIAPDDAGADVVSKRTADEDDFDRSVLFAPRDLGVKYNSFLKDGAPTTSQLTMDGDFAAAADTFVDMTPVTNIQAADRTADDRVAFTDIRWRKRYHPTTRQLRATIAKGALEP